jgi:hypothetical protein
VECCNGEEILLGLVLTIGEKGVETGIGEMGETDTAGKGGTEIETLDKD